LEDQVKRFHSSRFVEAEPQRTPSIYRTLKIRHPTQLDDEGVRAATQPTLIEFLHTELRVGPRFAESASRAKASGHLDHYLRGKRNAVMAAEFVQHFVNRVADKTIRNEISLRLAELDRLISKL
jgi:hypothetical protein